MNKFSFLSPDRNGMQLNLEFLCKDIYVTDLHPVVYRSVIYVHMKVSLKLEFL